MEDFHKNNYTKEYRKKQFQYRKTFNYNKKKYNPNFYIYKDNYFHEKNELNKNNNKTSFNTIESTKKKSITTYINNNTKNEEIKNIKKENNYINNNSTINNIILKRDINREQIMPNLNNNILSNFSSKNSAKNDNSSKNISKINYFKKNINIKNKNELYNINSSNIKLNQSSQLIPFYNSPNFNYNNNFYLYTMPQKMNNSINNYYINNNIIIYNGAHNNIIYSNPNLNNNNSIINFNNNVVNPYISKNYFNNLLFSKNEEESNSDKNGIIDPKKENTCILEINIKFGENKNYNFKLNRFDDLFETVHIFCQINSLNSNLYIPIIINIMKALNSIYGIYNMKLKEKEINELHFLKYFFFNSNDDSI